MPIDGRQLVLPHRGHLLQEWQGGLGPPAWEAAEGVPCRTGLLDGALALTAALAAPGPGSEAYKAVRQSGLVEAAVQLLVSAPAGTAAGLQEVYPRGLLSLLQVGTATLLITHSFYPHQPFPCNMNPAELAANSQARSRLWESQPPF